jgi:hypothetical protein
MKTFFVKTGLVIFLLFSTTSLFSSTGKYRLILNDNPATTITIAWDQESGTDPVVYYDTVDHGSNYSAYQYTKDFDRQIYYRDMDNTFARLTGLLPNTAYYFVIQDSEGTSDRYWFKTAPDDLSRLSFIAGGDSRSQPAPRRRGNTLVSKLKPHAVIFGGDMVVNNSGSRWAVWLEDWQLTTANDGRMIPIIAAQGNHEYGDDPEAINKIFDTPENEIYAVGFGDDLFRVYTLNSEIYEGGSQRKWLENDLAENTKTIWKAAQYHKPMRPHHSGKPNNNDAYGNWAELFFTEGVRIVIENDAHTVKTTWPIEPSSKAGSDDGFIRNDEEGSVYIGEGCWGAPLRDNDDDKEWTRASGKFFSFNLIFVEPSKVEIRKIKTDSAYSVGEVSNDDSFSLPENLDVWNPSNGTGSVIEIDSTSSCGGHFDLPNKQWRQISLPCDPGSSNQVSNIFSNMPGTYDTDWAMYRYDTKDNTYVNLGLDGILKRGEGYWIIQNSEAPISLTMPQGSTLTTAISTNIPLATKNGVNQWNMIGYPYGTEGVLNNATVLANSGNCAPSCDLNTAKDEGIAHNQLWNYDGINYTLVNITDNLKPWIGYWLPTLSNATTVAPVTLSVPKP